MKILATRRAEMLLLLLGSERQWLLLLCTHFSVIPAQLESGNEAPHALEHFCPFEFFPCATHLQH